MKKVSVRDLRYDFPAVERLLSQGEPVEITKRRRTIARLLPVAQPKPPKTPDFLARIRAIYGDKVLTETGASIIAKDRDRY
ncbi:MAG: hypothetical protein JO336_23320 [Acidobacteriia bacterium]|nr:hypothetical protein [Terriglobia bacterium]MBV8902751.1 hypothetical protein [Terriglobia bacterium]